MSADGAAAPPVALPIEQSALVLGGHVWVERRLFEVVGAFAADEADAAATIFFDATARYHAWHAGLFADLLPLVPGLDHAALVSAPTPAAEGVLGDLAGRTATLDRLAGTARVLLPRLVAGYRAHLAGAAPVADAPVVRVLRLVLHDEVAALDQAEALLGRLGAAAPAALAAAVEGCHPLEAALAGAGPGMVPWPPPGPERRA